MRFCTVSWLAGVLLGVAVSLSGCGGELSSAAPAPVIAFTLTRFDGVPYRSAELHNHTVVINFWASWCLPCRAEAPALQQVWQAYRDKGVVFLGVLLQGDNREEAQTFLRDMGISYPHGQDDDGTLATAFQVSGVPTTFILNTEGRLVQRMIGPITAAYLRRRLEQVVVR